MKGLNQIRLLPDGYGDGFLTIQMDGFGALCFFRRGETLEEVVAELEQMARILINQSNYKNREEPLYGEINYSGFYFKRGQEEGACGADGNPCKCDKTDPETETSPGNGLSEPDENPEFNPIYRDRLVTKIYGILASNPKTREKKLRALLNELLA